MSKQKIVTESKNGMGLKANEIIEMLDVIVQTNKINEEIGLPRQTMCIWGLHGVGKTQNCEDYAKDRNMGFKTFSPAQLEEAGDMVGIPILKKNENGDEITTYAIPKFFPTDADYNENGGILLIDDFNRGDDRIIKALMELLQKYKTAAGVMPKGWTIVATANPDESDENYSVTTIDNATMTRMLHCTYTFDVDTFLAWGSQSVKDKSTYTFGRKLELANTDDRTKIHRRVIDFFNKFRNMVDGKQTTPRTIEMMSNIITLIPDWANNMGMIARIAHGCLSDITAGSFITYLNENIDMLDFKNFANAKTEKQFSKLVDEFTNILVKEDGQKVAITKILLENYWNYLINNDADLNEKGNEIKNFLKLLNQDIVPKDMVENFIRITVVNDKTKLYNSIFGENSVLGRTILANLYDVDDVYLEKTKEISASSN